MDDRVAEVVSALRLIEEQLADLAYEALQARIAGDGTARDRERRLLGARRAVARAISALDRSDDR